MGSTCVFSDTITIGNSTKDSVYNAYKVFDLVYNDAETNFAYTIDSSNPFFATVQSFATAANGLTLTQVGNTTTYNVTATDVFTGATAGSSPAAATGKAGDFAAALKAAYDAMQTKPQADGTATATADNQADLTIAVNDHGYYFLTTTTGTVCSLDSTTPDVTIKDKNDKPTIEKKVLEGTTWGETNDGEIGDTVNFRTVINAKVGANGYVLHDRMDDGLTWDGENAVSVYIEDTNGSLEYEGTKYTAVTAANAWSVAAGNEATTPCTFHVTFDNAWLATNITANKKLLVEYTATIDSDAVHSEPEYNKTWLKYGEDNHTEEDTTKTYTWEVNVYKYANGAEGSPLAGAKFRLLNADKTKAATFDANNKLTGWVALAANDNADNGIVTVGTELATPASGKLSYTGFDAGQYYLVETAAPDGYNKITAPVEITITSTETGTGEATTRSATITNAAVITDQKDGSGNALAAGDTGYDSKPYTKINNQAGSVLPSTGGSGTTMIYIIGVILLAGAGILLVTRRRMKAE